MTIMHSKQGISKLHHPKIQHKDGVVDKTTPNRLYYWIWAETDERRIVWGAYKTYQEAQRIAASKLNCPFEIIELNTRDESMASRILRARLLKESGDINSTFERFSHQIPQEYPKDNLFGIPSKL